MKHDIKSAIIGCGGISAVHIDAITRCELGRITAICDNDGERLLKTSLKTPGAATYSDYKELLDARRADVVHICTPHYLHAEMAIYAMETGHDVYLEKPMAMTLEEANKVVEVSKKTGKKVCVSFQNRVIPSALGIEKVIKSGEMGKLVGIKGLVTWCREGEYYTASGWRGKWETEGGGVLMNQSIHTLDLMCLFGGEVGSVEGTASLRTNRDIIEVEDTAEATIRFKSGVTGIFYATNCHRTSSPVEIEYVFEKGSMLVRDDLLYRLSDGKLECMAENSRPGVGKNVWGTGHAIMIDRFYGNLDGTSDEVYCTAESAVRVIGVIGEIYKDSAAHGGIVNPLIKA